MRTALQSIGASFTKLARTTAAPTPSANLEQSEYIWGNGDMVPQVLKVLAHTHWLESLL